MNACALDRRTPEVIVLIDWGTLVTGLHEQSLCETADGTPLPPAVVRRLCCDADIVPVVLGRGERIFDDVPPFELELRESTASPAATHVVYRIS